MTELHLHVGAHKTGSTLLQRALNRDRRKLERRGVMLLTRGDLEPLISRRLRGWRAGRQPIEKLVPVWEAIAEQTHDAKSVLISHEELLGGLRGFEATGRFYPEAGDVLAGLLSVASPSSVKVHLFTRRQDTFLEAVYLQSVRMGRTHSFDEWRHGLASTELRWTELIDRIEAVAGRPQVHYFEDIGNGTEQFVKRFFAETNTGVRPSLDLALETQNRAYSDVAVKIALAANPMLERKDRRKLRKYLEDNFSSTRYPRPHLFEDDQRLAILEPLAADNRELHERLVDSDLRESPYLPEALGR